jgi:hypothetical protein
MRPFALEITAGDFARHRRPTAYNRHTSVLNSRAAFLTAACLSGASTAPSHTAFLAIFQTSQFGGSSFFAIPITIDWKNVGSIRPKSPGPVGVTTRANAGQRGSASLAGVVKDRSTFERPPSAVRNRDAVDFDRAVAGLNGLTLDRCEPTAEEVA